MTRGPVTYAVYHEVWNDYKPDYYVGPFPSKASMYAHIKRYGGKPIVLHKPVGSLTA